MKIFFGLLVLIAYHQLGEWLMRLLSWPIPGAVVGMLLLFMSLLVINKPPIIVEKASTFLLRHLALLFVPAGVGIILLFDLLRDEWFAMLVSMVFSTLVSLVFVAFLMQKLINATPDND